VIETLQPFLLERPWRLSLTLVALQFLLICLWSWRRTTPTRRAVWIGFAAMPVLIVFSASITTTRERIILLCHDLARYVEEGNAAAILARLADDFNVDGLTLGEFEPRLMGALKRYRIDRPSLSRFDVALDGSNHATAVFDAACYVRFDDAIADRVHTRWFVLLRRTRDRWLVTGVKLIPRPLSPLRDLRTWIQ